jgi:hypothetical protein
MAGKIKKMIDQIIEGRSQGDPFLALTTKTKLLLKGINVEYYKDDTPDNLTVIKDLKRIARELNVTLQEDDMAIKPVYSMETSPEKNAAELADQLSDISPKLILFFASSNFEPAVLGPAIQKQFPTADIIGCTTAGELVNDKVLKNSVVAMAFDAEALDDVVVGVVENLKTENQVPQVFAAFEEHTGQRMIDLDINQYVGLILIDGLSGAEEKVMDKIGDLTNILFVGGSAADDMKLQTTYVFANGKAYTNAAVLALLKPKVGFDVVKTQSFCSTKKVLKATRVNEAERIVYEFDGQPAREAYASAVELPVDQASSKFMDQPFGLMVEGDPYVRGLREFQDDSLVFFCQVKEGMELSLLQSTDIVQDTRTVIQEKMEKLGQFSGLIHFNCCFRALQLEQWGQFDEYGKIFTDIPTVGFSTYGEQYLGHINQTSTMLIFV